MPTLRRGGKGNGKSVTVESVTRGKIIGGHGEGIVRDVDVTIGTRTRRMVQKEFHEPYAGDVNYRAPRNQFEIMHELIALNRKKKLGLNINPTIRLMENPEKGKKPFLVMTKLNIRKWSSLTVNQRIQFEKIRGQQIKILKENGYRTGGDSFFPILKDKKITAVISDFGNIRKLTKDELQPTQ
jgi:hypothetical protein